MAIVIETYSDGSATTADKPGGWGYVLIRDGIKIDEGNGHMDRGTNNDLELEGAIQALAAAYKNVMSLPAEDFNPGSIWDQIQVTLCSDSQIVLGWANGTHRFKQEAKYQRFDILKKLMTKMSAKTRWVRGHSGDEHNERCDELANLGRFNLGPNDRLPGKPTKSRAISKTTFLTIIKEIAKVAEKNASDSNMAVILEQCNKVLK